MLFETYIVLEILKAIQKMSTKPNLYHFRSYSGAEVDLILERNGMLLPIEIKMKSNPSGKDVKGSTALKKCFPHETLHTALIVCSIERPQMVADNVLAVPWWIL